jgi:hypothetical protein
MSLPQSFRVKLISGLSYIKKKVPYINDVMFAPIKHTDKGAFYAYLHAGSIICNYKNFEKLDDVTGGKLLQLLLMKMNFHLALNHIQRGLRKFPTVWQVACNLSLYNWLTPFCEVNKDLATLVGHIDPADLGLPRGLAAEEYYAILLEKSAEYDISDKNYDDEDSEDKQKESKNNKRKLNKDKQDNAQNAGNDKNNNEERSDDNNVSNNTNNNQSSTNQSQQQESGTGQGSADDQSQSSGIQSQSDNDSSGTETSGGNGTPNNSRNQIANNQNNSNGNSDSKSNDVKGQESENESNQSGNLNISNAPSSSLEDKIINVRAISKRFNKNIHKIFNSLNSVDPSQEGYQVSELGKAKLLKTLQSLGIGDKTGEYAELIKAVGVKVKIPNLTTVTTSIKGSFMRRTFAKPRKRTIESGGIFLPGRTYRGCRVGVIIDSSGSMSQEQLSWGLGVINNRLAKGEDVTLYIVDCELKEKFSVRSFVKDLKIPGRGGTDIVPAYKKAIEDNNDYIIIISDALVPQWPTECGVLTVFCFTPSPGTGIAEIKQTFASVPDWMVKCVVSDEDLIDYVLEG